MDNLSHEFSKQNNLRPIVSLVMMGNVVKIFIYFVILLMIPTTVYAKEIKLSLNSPPLQHSEIIKNLTLYEYDKTMGPGGSNSRIPQSVVSIGRPYIFLIKSQNKNANGQIISDTSDSAFYLVRLTFSFHELPEDKRYQKITSYVDLGDKNFIAYDLAPKNIVSNQQNKISYSILPEFKFKEIEVKLGGITEDSSFKTTIPIITAFGEGESQFYWTYTCRKGGQVLPGAKETYVIINVPKDTKIMEVQVAFKVIISQDYFGVWQSKETDTNTFTASWKLDGAPVLN